MSLRIQYMSDLHLEFRDNHGFIPDDVGADVLVLAGDIHLGTGALEWLHEFAHRYQDIIYFPGNHEYYHIERS